MGSVLPSVLLQGLRGVVLSVRGPSGEVSQAREVSLVAVFDEVTREGLALLRVLPLASDPLVGHLL
jgi:hypothetical protein